MAVKLKAKWEAVCSISTGTIYNFDYTGGEQTFTAPCDGYYKLEVWGAQGGGGKSGCNYSDIEYGGGYSSGIIRIEKTSVFYAYIGEKGHDGQDNTNNIGGYNGGGKGNSDHTCYIGGGGGGATDIRTINGSWDNANSLRSRIIVAGAGAGARSDSRAGGLMGYGLNGTFASTQVSGYSFGIGGGGKNGTSVGGSGAGWYGGLEGENRGGTYGYSGGGGSSYISGHAGSIAVTSSSNTNPKCSAGSTSVACSQSWTGYTFTNTLMIDGAGYKWTTSKQGLQQMPNPNGGYYASGVGHSGNGAARITYLGTSI